MTEVTTAPSASPGHDPEDGPPVAAPSARDRWLVLTAALLGWMFDGFEQGLFSLVGQPAVTDLLGPERAAEAGRWFGVIMAVFLVGAAAGGVLFGWLGDRIGRVRAMSLSILTYALVTGLCGLAQTPLQLAVLRFIASLGIGGEWALGVALVMEIWPDKSRAFTAGLIGAAANVGFLLVGLIGLVILSFMQGIERLLPSLGLSADATAWLLSGSGAGRGWRLLMIVGALPALLIFFIRLFVPESGKWEREKQRGATSHWATRDLLGVLLGSLGAGLVIFVWSPAVSTWSEGFRLGARAAGTTLGITVALLGFLFPVVRYLQRARAAASQDGGPVADVPGGVLPYQRAQIAPALGPTIRRMLLGASLAGVALLGTWGSLQWAPRWALALTKGDPTVPAKEWTTIAMAAGAIVGTITAALVAGRLGRRVTYAFLCVASLGSTLLLYQGNDHYGPKFLACVFLAGGLTAAFYGWFPLYLPELFRTSVRATAQGFSYNFGRIIAAIGTLQVATLMAAFARGLPPEQQSDAYTFPRAASVLAFIYLIGLAIVWLGPETKGKPLPE